MVSFACLEIHTFNLQLAGDSSLSLGVLGSAGVHSTIKAAGLTDLKRANALVGDLTKLGVVTNYHLIFQPLDLWLRGGEETKLQTYLYITDKCDILVMLML